MEGITREMRERTASNYGVTADDMQRYFDITYDILTHSENKKNVLIENLMKKYNVSKECVMVCLSCGALMA